MNAERRYDTAHGSVALRPERPEDEAFLLELFRSHSTGVLELAGMPPDAIDKLIDFQYRSQTATYRDLFPNAAFWIIQSGGIPIGRLIEEDEGDAVYFVDFALLPDRQRKGLGSAFIDMVADEWAKRGIAARVKVLINNEASLKLCRKCGFVQNESFDMGFIGLRREPPKA
jgi:GNAT superfamily N-acetyltransferase